MVEETGKTKRMQPRLKNRWYVVLAGIVFATSVALGFQYAFMNPDDADSIVRNISEGFAFARQLSPLSILVFIFFNNAIKSLLAMLLGVVFALPSLAFLVINGEILGIFLGLAYADDNLAFTLAALLPHGILEVPAAVLAAGLGIRLGFGLYRKLFYGDPLKPQFKKALGIYFKIIAPMILAAALIETFLTPLIIAWILK